MPYDEGLAQRIRQALKNRPVREIKMFGGLCFMVRGHMCCGTLKKDVIFRVGPELHAKAMALPHAKPMKFTGKAMKGFVLVPPAGVKMQSALAKWVRMALEYNKTLPAKA